MNKTEGQMIDRTDMEASAIQSCLGPMGEYVGALGMHRPLSDYSREEVLALIDVVIGSYQDCMLKAHENLAAKDRSFLSTRLARLGVDQQQGRV